MKKFDSVMCGALFCLVASVCVSAQQFIGSSQFSLFDSALSTSDISPFSSTSFSCFYLEGFEDELLNSRGVSLREFAAADISATFSDSVDRDDGTIDGVSTENATSLFSGFRTSSFTFDFDPTALDGYPTHAGIVWTDIGRTNSGTPDSAA